MRLGLTLLLWLALASPTWAVVALDACTADVERTSSGWSFSHTTGSGANRLMLLVLGINGVNGTGATYNGGAQTLTLVDRQIGGDAVRRVEMWQLVAPASGTSNVSVTTAGSQNVWAKVCTFTGVDQATPLGTVAKNGTFTGVTTIGVTVTSAVGAMAMDIIQISQVATALAADAGQANVSTIQGANLDFGSSTEVGAASVTMTWNWTNNASGSQLAAPINAAAATASGGMKARKPVRF